MCALLLGIGVMVLEKHTTEFWVVYCLNKSFGGFYRLMFRLKKENAFYFFIPFL
jgi:hypothetical protein